MEPQLSNNTNANNNEIDELSPYSTVDDEKPTQSLPNSVISQQEITNQTASPQQIGYISEEDKQHLLKAWNRSLQPLKIIRNIFIVAAVVVVILSFALIKSKSTAVAVAIFWDVLAVVVIYIMNFYYKRNKKLKMQLLDQPIPVERITGVVSYKSGGVGINAYAMSIVSINGIEMPQIVGYLIIRPYKDKVVTFEYFPTLKLNRCFYDAEGNGYNFFTLRRTHA